jgi:SAM-dependent methyltransferase
MIKDEDKQAINSSGTQIVPKNNEGKTENNLYVDSWRIYKAHSETFSDDTGYYIKLCTGFKTLELFAGYGRLSNPLVAAGIDLETVELEGRFTQCINLLPDKNHIGDVLTFQSPYKFERIIAGYNSFCLFTRDDDIRKFFSQVDDLLVPGGIASLNYYHQDYWATAVSYDFSYGDQTIHYQPRFDLSKAETDGQGLWIDEYSSQNGWMGTCKYPTRVYRDAAELRVFFSHTKLELIREVREFGMEPNQVSEPGWIDYVLQKGR